MRLRGMEANAADRVRRGVLTAGSCDRSRRVSAASGRRVARRATRWLELMRELYPLRRSLTGNGVRETLRIARRRACPSRSPRSPSGTPIFDWVVPQEWNVATAGSPTRGRTDRRLRETTRSTSSATATPVARTMRARSCWSPLVAHPSGRTGSPRGPSYWERRWGFCLADGCGGRFADDDEYDVCIDATLDETGTSPMPRPCFPGRPTTRSCSRPTPAIRRSRNDNLSGIVVAAPPREHARRPGRPAPHVPPPLQPGHDRPARPGSPRTRSASTGSRAGARRRLRRAIGPVTYKRSRRGDAEVDRAAAHVLRLRGRTASSTTSCPGAPTSGSSARRGSTSRWSR